MEFPYQNQAIFRSLAEESEKAEEPIDGEPLSEILDDEEASLAKLGYKQEFKREFSWISTFSFALSISGLLATVAPKSMHRNNLLGYNNVRLSLGGRRAACRRVVLVSLLEREFDNMEG
jgi:hypothetical protein